MIDLLLEREYRLYWHLPALFNPRNFAEKFENVFGYVGSINMLGVPRERPLNVTGLREVTGPTNDWRGSE